MAKSTLEKLVWNLQRFGLSPHKLRWRSSSPDTPPIFIQSIPKSGTHLVERALCLHPPIHRRILHTLEDDDLPARGGWEEILRSTRPGQVLFGHLDYAADRARALEEHGFRSLFVVRDPRDIVISDCKYIARSKTHRRYRLYCSRPDLANQIRLNIEGLESKLLPSLRMRLERYVGWIGTDALRVRFEDLVGETGGGEKTTQRRVLERFHNHGGTGATTGELQRIHWRRFPSASSTFREGQIGQWKVHFEDNRHRLVEDRVGDPETVLGYGQDNVS